MSGLQAAEGGGGGGGTPAHAIVTYIQRLRSFIEAASLWIIPHSLRCSLIKIDGSTNRLPTTTTAHDEEEFVATVRRCDLQLCFDYLMALHDLVAPLVGEFDVAELQHLFSKECAVVECASVALMASSRDHLPEEQPSNVVPVFIAALTLRLMSFRHWCIAHFTAHRAMRSLHDKFGPAPCGFANLQQLHSVIAHPHAAIMDNPRLTLSLSWRNSLWDVWLVCRSDPLDDHKQSPPLKPTSSGSSSSFVDERRAARYALALRTSSARNPLVPFFVCAIHREMEIDRFCELKAGTDGDAPSSPSLLLDPSIVLLQKHLCNYISKTSRALLESRKSLMVSPRGRGGALGQEAVDASLQLRVESIVARHVLRDVFPFAAEGEIDRLVCSVMAIRHEHHHDSSLIYLHEVILSVANAVRTKEDGNKASPPPPATVHMQPGHSSSLSSSVCRGWPGPFTLFALVVAAAHHEFRIELMLQELRNDADCDFFERAERANTSHMSMLCARLGVSVESCTEPQPKPPRAFEGCTALVALISGVWRRAIDGDDPLVNVQMMPHTALSKSSQPSGNRRSPHRSVSFPPTAGDMGRSSSSSHQWGEELSPQIRRSLEGLVELGSKYSEVLHSQQHAAGAAANNDDEHDVGHHHGSSTSRGSSPTLDSTKSRIAKLIQEVQQSGRKHQPQQ